MHIRLAADACLDAIEDILIRASARPVSLQVRASSNPVPGRFQPVRTL